MNVHTVQLGFFITLISLAVVLNFFVFLPYVSVVFLAAVLAVSFQPVYTRIRRVCGGREALAAFLCVCIVLLFILGPLALFGTLLFQESTSLYQSIASGESRGVGMLAEALYGAERMIHKVVPQFPVDLHARFDVEQYVGKVLVWFSQHMAGFFSSIVRGVFGFFLMVLALFYFFKDGGRFVGSVRAISPLFDGHDSVILKRLADTVNSVVRGQLAVALVQGILTGLGFFVFGIPNPVLWGSCAAIASLVPTLGTGLVIAPAIIYLYVTGSGVQALGLAAWGICAVGLIDNVLSPLLVKRGLKIHSFVILLSVLGGIALFGPIGFIAGPVSLSLLVSLLDVYPTLVKRVKEGAM